MLPRIRDFGALEAWRRLEQYRTGAYHGYRFSNGSGPNGVRRAFARFVLCAALSRAHLGLQADSRLILLGSLLYTAGSAILYVLPAYFTELSTRYGISEAQMGSISAAENVGLALASILCTFWLSRLNFKLLVICAACFCAVFNILAFFSQRAGFLVATRFCTGVFGEGFLFSSAFTVLGATRDPDRSFGIGLTTVVAFGSVVLAGSTLLDRVPHGTGALLPLAIVPLAVLFVVKWLPPSSPAHSVDTTARISTTRLTKGLAVVAIAGMTICFAAPGAFWTFAESEATHRQIPTDVISIALAIGNSVGLLGSVTAAWQGERWGRAAPIVAASAGLWISVAAFEQSSGLTVLAAALAAFNVFWNYGTVYQMGLVVALDPAGRMPMAIPAAQVMGFAAGGFVSGIAISRYGYPALLPIVFLFACGGLLILSICFRAAKSATSVS